MENNVIGFFSPIPGSGTTSTVLSIAQSIAKHTNQKVGVLSLNVFDDNSDYIAEAPSFLDEIKTLLAGRSFQSEKELLSKFAFQEGVYILAGNKNRRLERQFQTSEIDYLIEVSSQAFDLVLIDGGSHFDNALSVISLVKSKQRFMVVTQQPKALKRFQQLNEQLLRPMNIDFEDFSFILNNFQDKTFTLSSKQVMRELEIEKIQKLPYVEKAIIAEIDSSSIYQSSDERYKTVIDMVAKDITHVCELQWIDEGTKQKFFNIFRKKRVS